MIHPSFVASDSSGGAELDDTRADQTGLTGFDRHRSSERWRSGGQLQAVEDLAGDVGDFDGGDPAQSVGHSSGIFGTNEK